MYLDELIKTVASGQDLDEAQTMALFEGIVSGALDREQIKSFLFDIARKGPSISEIVGAARVMRRHVTPIACANPNAIDTCGTGGDGISTFNVSTAAAIVASAAGATVAKHGNHTHSRRSGSAECIRALGVNIDLKPDRVAECLNTVGIAFLYAVKLHPAMARVAEIRREIVRPTIFNLLGPLTNPAGVTRQIIGVPRPELLEPMAQALLQLGVVHGIVVHGCGLCDFTVTGRSTYVEVAGESIRSHEIDPTDLGFETHDLGELCIESPAESAVMIREVLTGNRGGPRNHTVLNAAAALVVAGVAPDLGQGLALAATAIDSGAAHTKLQGLIEFTNS